MAELVKSDGVKYDNLIGGSSESLLTKNVTVTAKAGGYQRGELLVDKLAIVAEPVAANATVATVYVKGIFNKKTVIGDVDTNEAALRDAGIFFTEFK